MKKLFITTMLVFLLVLPSALAIFKTKEYDTETNTVVVADWLGLSDWFDLYSVRLIENTDQCFDCYTIYELCNLKDSNLSYDDMLIKFYGSQAENTNFELQNIVTYYETVNDYKTCTRYVNETVFNNQSKENVTEEVAYQSDYCITGTHQEEMQRIEWDEITLKTLESTKPTECITIKVSGSLEPSQAVDNRINLLDVEVSEFAWWNNNWTKCQNITITNPSGANHAEIPVFLNITYDSDMQADFREIIFVNESCRNGGSELYHDKINFTNSGLAYVNVNVDNLTATRTISMHYGNAIATDSQDPANTYNENYTFVIHLAQPHSIVDENHSNYIDSTTGKICTTQGFDGDEQIAGPTGYGLELLTNDFLNCTSGIHQNADFTIYGWWYKADEAVGSRIYFSNFGGGVDPTYTGTESNDNVRFGKGFTNIEIGAWTNGVWYNPVWRNDKGTNAWLFWNGMEKVSHGSAREEDDIDNEPWYIGAQGANENEWWEGGVSEIRYTNYQLTDQWINFTYENIANYDNIISFGAEEDSVTNNLPVITAPDIDPFNIYTDNDTSANSTYTDADGDDGNITFEWFVDNRSIQSETFDVVNNTNIVSNFSSSNYNYSSEIVLNITAFDNNSAASVPVNSTLKTVLNSLSIWSETPNDFSVQFPTNLSYDLNATDIDTNDDQTLIYFINDSNFAINNLTGLITRTITQNIIGNYSITVNVTDSVSWLNASFIIELQNISSPIAQGASILPTPIYYNTSMWGSCNISHTDVVNMTYDYKWWNNSQIYLTGVLNQTSIFNTSITRKTGVTVTDLGNFSDNDWTTSAFVSAGNGILYLNYSINYTPTSALWEVKDKCGHVNLTIPASCLNTTTLQLLLNLNVAGNVKWRCNNGTDTPLLRECIGTPKIYEDKVYINGYLYNGLTNISTLTVDKRVGDNWTFECRGFDQFSYSERINSSATQISNTLPSWIETPDNFSIAYSFNVSYDLNATDPNTEQTLIYYINDASFDISSSTGLINKTTIISDVGNYSIIVNVTDGLSWLNASFTIEVLNVTEANFTPTVTARIAPTAPFTNDTLLLGYCTGSDQNNDNLSYSWKWWNNTEIIVTANSSSINSSSGLEVNVANLTISPSNFMDNFTIECMAYDGLNYSNATNSTSVYVNNTAPSITKVEITPASPNTTQPLTCTIAGFDPEGQNFTIEWQWYNNSNYFGGGNYTNALSGVDNALGTIQSNQTLSGDNWNCTATAHDNYGSGSSVRNSSEVDISYIFTLVQDRPANNTVSTEDGIDFVCNASAMDVDVDNISIYVYNSSATYYSNTVNVGASTISKAWNLTGVPNGFYNWTCIAMASDQTKVEGNFSLEVAAFWDIDNCTANNLTTILFTIYDENIPTTQLNATLELDLTYWGSNPSNNKTYNTIYRGASEYSVCINVSDLTLNAKLYVSYNTTGGFTHRYILVQEQINSTQQNLSLYNFGTQTGISDLHITTRNQQDYKYYSKVISKLQRRYISEGVWRTVQMDQSGDFGTIVFHVLEQDTDYRIIFIDQDNNIIKESDSMKFICTDGLCELTFLLNPFAVTAATFGVSVNRSYDPLTKNFTTVWVNNQAMTSTVNTRVTKYTNTGTVEICDITQTGAGGSNQCDTSVYTGPTLYQVIADGEVIVSEWYQLNTTSLTNWITDAEGGIWTVAIINIAVMFGAMISPASAMIAMVIGLIATFVLGMFNAITLPFIIIAAIVGIAIGMKVKK